MLRLIESLEKHNERAKTMTNFLTYQYRLEQAAEYAETRKEMDCIVIDCIVKDILKEDERNWIVTRNFAGYGTWHITIWVNGYRFGHDLAKKLNYKYIVTHDEDKQFTLDDFEDIINDVCLEYAYNKF